MSIDGWTVEKALKVGVTMETGAYNLYTSMAKKVKDPGSKKLLTEIAGDEKKHREYFESRTQGPEEGDERGEGGRREEGDGPQGLRPAQGGAS